MNRRKILLYVAAVVFIGLTIWVIFTSSRAQKQNTLNTTSTAPEIGPVSLQNAESLSNLLLQKQFNSLLYALSDFIQKRVDANNTSASVIGSPTTNADGSITFSVLLNTPKKQSFSVNVDRSIFDHLTMTVPDYQYTKSISVY